MDFLKKNYEKVLFGVVLIGLSVAVAFLPVKIRSEKQNLDEMRNRLLSPKVQPLTNVDLSFATGVLKRASSPVVVALGEPHRLFNPMPWQKTTDGRLVKKDDKNLGPQAVAVTDITPLYLKLTLDSVQVADSPRYVIGIERQAAPTRSQQAKRQSYSKLNEKGDVFTPREVVGSADNPTALILELTDGTRVELSREQPFRRVDGYMADLKYPPENKTWADKRVNETIGPIAGETYKIVAIAKDEVILLAPSGKKTSIRYNAVPEQR
jgi:hypothetical protein